MFARPYGAFGGSIGTRVGQSVTAPAPPQIDLSPSFDSQRWARASALLADLGCLGPLWMEVGNTALRLAMPAPVPLRLAPNGAARATIGDGGSLYWLPRQWMWLWGVPGGQTLSIEDAAGETLLKLVPRRPTPGFAFAHAALLKAYGGGPRIWLDMAPNTGCQPLRDAGAHPVWSLLAQTGAAGTQDASVADLAELSGMLALDPNRPRAMGEAIAVDPSLVAGLLDICTDQYQAIWCAMGNAGVLVTRNLQLAHAQSHGGRRWLRGRDVAISLDPEGLDSAWVVERDGVH
ncbi:hypothetical protein Thiowin_02096 [Thiorhodovibrio winogradskyi]|uniref:Uncharacterized protein n=1 Tax=Thiorhodovibrio winogradskyi TaxID=77007 RepID=A0ABZ0S7Y7_9GAMM|nr:hypothetical protein [Thiorhodovibrio winogradskyi]